MIEVKPDDLQKQIYEALRDRYAGLLQVTMTDRVTFARMGDVFMYLLEAATNPQLLSAGSGADDQPEFRHPPLDVPPGSKRARSRKCRST